jgi:hypothetical protein
MKITQSYRMILKELLARLENVNCHILGQPTQVTQSGYYRGKPAQKMVVLASLAVQAQTQSYVCKIKQYHFN